MGQYLNIYPAKVREFNHLFHAVTLSDCYCALRSGQESGTSFFCTAMAGDLPGDEQDRVVLWDREIKEGVSNRFART